MESIALVIVCPWHAKKILVYIYVYRQNEMRAHLISCLENGILTEFPVVRKKIDE